MDSSTDILEISKNLTLLTENDIKKIDNVLEV